MYMCCLNLFYNDYMVTSCLYNIKKLIIKNINKSMTNEGNLAEACRERSAAVTNIHSCNKYFLFTICTEGPSVNNMGMILAHIICSS